MTAGLLGVVTAGLVVLVWLGAVRARAEQRRDRRERHRLAAESARLSEQRDVWDVLMLHLDADRRAVAAVEARLEEDRRARAAPVAVSWLEGKRRKQLLVHLTDDSSIRGTLLEVSDEGLLLGAAEYLDGNPTPLGGEIYLPRDRVAFLQSTR